MTPEEQVDALKGLLGRVRANAGERLVWQSGDEEDFVPRSVLAARAEAASEALAAIEASSGTHAATNGVDGAATNGVGGHEQPEDARPPGRHRFVPEDARFDTEPPPTAIPGGGGSSLEEALLQVEASVLGPEAVAEEEIPCEAPQAATTESAPPLDLELFDPFDEPTATGSPDELELLAMDEEPAPPTPRSRVDLPPAPFSSTRAVSARPPPETDDGGELEAAPSSGSGATRRDGPAEEPELEEGLLPLSFEEETHDRPTRHRDPLARTAQNPIPAAMFERELLDEADASSFEPPLDRPAPASREGASPAPEEPPDSSRRPVDVDRPVEVGLDSEPPPQSGEVTSQRQPAAPGTRRGSDLDAPTPTTDEGMRVAQEAERLRAEVLPSAPPPTRPGVVGQRPLATTSFLAVLDVALALAEREP